MSCIPKQLKIYEKYSKKIHEGFCEAAGLEPEKVESIGSLLRNFVDRYYPNMNLLPWRLDSSVSIGYFPKERKIFFCVIIKKLMPISFLIEEYFSKYKKEAGYYLQPIVENKENDMQQVSLIYNESNVTMRNLKDTVYKVMSQLLADGIDDYLDPFLRKIKEYQEVDDEQK